MPQPTDMLRRASMLQVKGPPALVPPPAWRSATASCWASRPLCCPARMTCRPGCPACSWHWCAWHPSPRPSGKRAHAIGRRLPRLLAPTEVERAIAIPHHCRLRFGWLGCSLLQDHRHEDTLGVPAHPRRGGWPVRSEGPADAGAVGGDPRRRLARLVLCVNEGSSRREGGLHCVALVARSAQAVRGGQPAAAAAAP